MTEAATREHAKLLEGMRQCMGTPEGRALLRWLLDRSRALHADYTAESGAMYFMQGQRSVGFALLNLAREQNENNLATLMLKEERNG